MRFVGPTKSKNSDGVMWMESDCCRCDRYPAWLLPPAVWRCAAPCCGCCSGPVLGRAAQNETRRLQSRVPSSTRIRTPGGGVLGIFVQLGALTSCFHLKLGCLSTCLLGKRVMKQVEIICCQQGSFHSYPSIFSIGLQMYDVCGSGHEGDTQLSTARPCHH